MIKFYFIILVTTVVVPHAILALEPAQGTVLYKTPRKLRTSRATRDLDDNPLKCPSDVMGPVCSSDCKTTLTCISGNLISSTKCADVSNSNPYCIPNTFGCTNEPDLSIESCVPRTTPPVEFTCTGQGYFPSPHNCAEFFLCTPDSLYKHACPPNYVYDSATKNCHFEGECYKIDCTPTPNKFVVHPENNAYYAFCSYSEGISETMVFRCGHSETHVFNPDKINCEFRCRREGWFQHESNPSDYYECYYSDNILVHRIQSCPGDYIFDNEVKYCTPDIVL